MLALISFYTLFFFVQNSAVLVTKPSYCVIAARAIKSILKSYAVASFILFKLSFFVECAVLFGHALLTSSTRAATFFIAALFILTVRSFVESARYNSPRFLKTMGVFFAVNFFVLTLWLSNSALAFIFSVDALNILFYILFFEQISSRRASHMQSIAVYFWTSFVVTMLFFLMLVQLFVCFFSIEASLVFFIATLSQSSSRSSAVFVLFFVLFFFIKAGMAPFFSWKYAALKSAHIRTLLFYVCFYFTFVFLFLVKLLAFFSAVITITGSIAYCVLVAAAAALILFKSGTATIARFVTYSTALNCFWVCCVLCVFYTALWEYRRADMNQLTRKFTQVYLLLDSLDVCAMGLVNYATFFVWLTALHSHLLRKNSSRFRSQGQPSCQESFADNERLLQEGGIL